MPIWKSKEWWRDQCGFETPAAKKHWDKRLVLGVGLIFAVLCALTLIGAVVMVWRTMQTEVTGVGNPFEVIFASRLMVASARLAILFLGLYVVLSVLMHIKRGQWLTGAGFFKVSDAARVLEDESEDFEDDARRVLRENDTLRARNTELTAQIRTLETTLARIQATLEGPPSG